jgi:hypothetical protein
VGYSYAVDFNSYANQGLPESAEMIALDVLGTRTRLGATPFPHVDQGVLHTDIRVTPNRLVVMVSGGKQKLIPTVVFASPPFIVGFFQAPAPLYYGFTAGTGGLQQVVDILNFRIQTGLPPL